MVLEYGKRVCDIFQEEKGILREMKNQLIVLRNDE